MISIATHSIRACLALTLAFMPIAATAKSANTLNDLVGARAAGGESDLEARGWTMITGHKGSNAVYNYWWSRERKDCVMVTTRNGDFSAITDASASDCNQKSSSGSDAGKVAAVAGAAALLAALLAHKSGHHDDGQHDTDSQNEADYERGYRDGLHNSAWRNDSRSESYGTGYQAGVDQRQREIDHGSNFGNNSYSDNSGGYRNTGGNGSGSVGFSDLVGAKAAGVESDLQSRGFRNVDGFESGNGKGTIWWNGRTRQCLQMITADGRADSITDIQTHPRCR